MFHVLITLSRYDFSFNHVFSCSFNFLMAICSFVEQSWGGGAKLRKLRRAEGGANIFGVFRVKNHDFTPKK